MFWNHLFLTQSFIVLMNYVVPCLKQYFNNTDEKQPEMCYHLKSCVPKLVKKVECPLEKNNYIDHR
jgi:hypothetical protein